MLHTPSFSNCFGACSALCMKYCSVSNYFTRAYAIYIYIFILSLYSLYFILLLLLSLLLLFSFLLVFFFFSLFLFLLFVQKVRSLEIYSDCTVSYSTSWVLPIYSVHIYYTNTDLGLMLYIKPALWVQN